jgi:hypothetical protein
MNATIDNKFCQSCDMPIKRPHNEVVPMRMALKTINIAFTAIKLVNLHLKKQPKNCRHFV